MINGVFLFIFLSHVGAIPIKIDGVTHGSESGGLLLLGFFLIGFSGFVKRIKK